MTAPTSQAVLSELPASELMAFKEALHGGKGAFDAWLEGNNEAECRAFIKAYAADAAREAAGHAPKQLTDEQIDRIAKNCAKAMPDGIRGFCVTWGWRQFARELLDVCAGHERAAGHAPSPDAWISVSERLPERNIEVLVAFAGQMTLASTGQYTASKHDKNGWCYPVENKGICDDGSDPIVTHWMPLPDVPAAPLPHLAALPAGSDSHGD